MERRDPRLYRAIKLDPESTRCPTEGCNLPVTLLSHPGFVTGLPSFYVCGCGFIGQVGVGPVRLSLISYLGRWHQRALRAERRLKRLAPVYTIAASAPLHAQLTEVMRVIKACDGKPGEDGACDCARYIGGLLVRYGKHGRRQ